MKSSRNATDTFSPVAPFQERLDTATEPSETEALDLPEGAAALIDLVMSGAPLESLTVSPPRAGAIEDPMSAMLHAEANASYSLANSAYRAGKAPKYVYITLNSVRRTSTQQADHYDAYLKFMKFGGPKAPPANKPGQSFHQYGFAMDVVLTGDERAIRKALVGEKWIANKPREPWHFEAVSGPEYGKTKIYIKSTTVKAVANAYEAGVFAALTDEKYYKGHSADYERERRPLEAELSQLRKEKAVLDQRRRALLTEQNRLRQEQSRISSETSAISGLQNRLNNMQYTSCPNRQPYNQCDHVDLKRKYDQQRQRLQHEISNRTIALRQRRSRFQQDTRVFQASYSAYQADVQGYERKQADFDSRWKAFLLKHKDILEVLDRITQWPNRRAALLSDVDKVVGSAP